MAIVNAGLSLTSPIATGGTAHSLSTTTSYSSGFLLDLKNAGVSNFRVSYDGGTRIGLSTKISGSDLELNRATGTATPTPVLVRLRSTSSANDWSTTLPWATLDFYQDDTSSVAGTRGQISMIATSATGGAASMVFNVWSGAVNTEMLRLNSASSLITLAVPASFSSNLAVGGATSAAAGVWIRNTALAGGSQYGLLSVPVFTSAATSEMYAVLGRVDSAAATYTTTTAAAFQAQNPSKGSGHTITTNYGLRVDALTAGATNWAVYTAGTTNSAFGGSVRVGGTTAPVSTLDVTGTLGVSSTITSGLINGQTISSSANLTGSLTVASTYTGSGAVSVSAASATSFIAYTGRNTDTTPGSTVLFSLPVFNGTGGFSITQSTNGTGPAAWATGAYDALIRTHQSGANLHFIAGNGTAALVTLSSASLSSTLPVLVTGLIRSTVSATGSTSHATRVTGDSSERWFVAGDGKNWWSDGAGGGYDVNIGRTAANTLSLVGSLRITRATAAVMELDGQSTTGLKSLIGITGGGGSTTYRSYIGHELAASGAGELVFGNGTAQATITNLTERLRITATGKVGIGISTPSGVLDLGLAASGRGLSWGGTANNYANIWTPFSTSGLVMAVGLRGGTAADDYVSSYGVSAMGRAAIRADAFGADAGKIRFYTDASATVADGTNITPTLRMTINSSGLIEATGSANFSGQLSAQGPGLSYVGIYAAPANTLSGSTIQYGILGNATFGSGATVAGHAMRARIYTQATAFTMTSGYGMNIASPNLGASSVITNLYGLYIEDQNLGSSTNYAIYTNAGAVRLGGATTIVDLLTTAASVSANAGLRIPHGAAPTSPIDGDMWTTTTGAFIRINGVTKQFTVT